MLSLEPGIGTIFTPPGSGPRSETYTDKYRVTVTLDCLRTRTEDVVTLAVPPPKDLFGFYPERK